MPLLMLKFKIGDEDSQVSVERTRFVIGRHSQCDLTISDARLSREHLVIEQRENEFYVSDLGSSNGTQINGEATSDEVVIKNGDVLNLGGFEIEVEIEEKPDEIDPIVEPPMIAPPTQNTATPAANSVEPSGFPKVFFIIAPLMVLGVIVALGMIIFMSRSNQPIDNSNFVYSSDPEPTVAKNRSPETKNTPSNTSFEPSNQTISNSNSDTPPPTSADINTQVEQNAALFLKNAAANDPRAYITGAQAQIVSAKIRSLASSSALSDNLASARKNATGLKALATEKNLKPSLLTAAAIAKMGNTRGDVLTTARSMAETLDKLGTQIGNELGEDCMLMFAAYDQGDPMKMRNMLQSLATSATESSRTVRTIWYLKKVGKITDAEYEAALRFLAVGTIAQNPKAFGVNAEAVTF